MGMVFSNFLHFPELWVWFSVRIQSLMTCFDIPDLAKLDFQNV